jgi:hypothetical protein
MVYLKSKHKNIPTTSAILLVLFNRPQYFQQMAESINKINPPKIYIHIDGPRNDEDLLKINEIKNLLENIDKNIHKEVLIQDKNLGCGLGMVTAINWFFDNEEDGIILEDDCIPDLSFYNYCNKLLSQYKDNDNIFMISGDNGGQIIPEKFFGNDNLISIPTPLIWGWATWRNRWKEYEYGKPNLNYLDIFKKLKEFKIFERLILIKYFYKLQNYESLNTWDIHLFYKLVMSRTRCIIPKVNLIKNIGFGEEATHTMETTFRSNAEIREIDIRNTSYTKSTKVLNSKITYLLHSNLESITVHNHSLFFIRITYIKSRIFYIAKSIISKISKEMNRYINNDNI